MIKSTASSILLLTLCSTNAFAQDDYNYYAGAAVSSQTLKLDNENKLYNSGEFKSKVLTPFIGYQFNQYVAVETRFGFGKGDDSEVIASQPITITDEYELDNQQGLLLKLQYPMTQSFSLFATAGYFNSKFKVRSKYEQNNSAQYTAGDYRENGASFGFGASYALNQNWQLSGEFQYFDQGDDKSEALTAAISYRF